MELGFKHLFWGYTHANQLQERFLLLQSPMPKRSINVGRQGVSGQSRITIGLILWPIL